MSFISVVSNVRVIPNEVCIKQHHMVVSDFTTHISCVKKHKVSPQIRKLRDPVTVSQFQSAFKYSLVKAEGSIAGCCHQSLWSLQEPSVEILNLVVEWLDRRSYKKHARFKAYSALKKGGMAAEAKGAKPSYMNDKCMAKYAVWMTKFEAEKEEFAAVSSDGDGVICITKQMDHTNQDVVGECDNTNTKMASGSTTTCISVYLWHRTIIYLVNLWWQTKYLI